jgi:hypothetical protein
VHRQQVVDAHVGNITQPNAGPDTDADTNAHANSDANPHADTNTGAHTGCRLGYGQRGSIGLHWRRPVKRQGHTHLGCP